LVSASVAMSGLGS